MITISKETCKLSAKRNYFDIGPISPRETECPS